MCDLGRMTNSLGVEVCQNGWGIFISQGKYANEVLQILDMIEVNPV